MEQTGESLTCYPSLGTAASDVPTLDQVFASMLASG